MTAPVVVVFGLSIVGSVSSQLRNLAHALRIGRRLSVVFRRMQSNRQHPGSPPMTGTSNIVQ